MVQRSKGFRSKTRSLMSKRPRDRGNPPPSHRLRVFDVGSSVAIVINPSVHKGMPHPRFQGLTGKVVAQRGDAFIIEAYAKNKLKTVIARPEHLKLITAAPAPKE